MTQQFITGEVARWEVIWWNRKTRAFTVKEFENDLASAEDLYSRATAARKPLATLRCCNVGFPPPFKYRPYVKTVKQETGRTKIVRRGGKRYRKKLYKVVEVEVEPMVEVNLRGVWWCPYCRKMRKFRTQDGRLYVDQGHEYYLDGKVVCCPVCQITHTNHHVRKWNPHAQRLSYRPIKQTRTRRSNGTRRRRTRSR